MNNIATRIGSEALYAFGSRPVSIIVRMGARHAHLIADLLKGWGVRLCDDQAADPHFELITHTDHKVYMSGRWVGPGYRVKEDVDIACSFIAEALKTQANENTSQFCVHAASAVFAGQAVILSGGFRTGKSTLAAVLASRGLAIIGDDAVFISPQRQSAIGPGIAPRLRIPLPDNLSEHTQQFLCGALRLTGERYAYLALPGNSWIANGEEVRLGAFVFVNRVEGAKTEIINVSKSDALKKLIWQNFARQVPANRILAALSRLVQTRNTVELRYDDVEQAADILIDTFKDWLPAPARQNDPKPLDIAHILQASEPEFRINREIEEEQIDTGHFIADKNTGRIFYLNAIGAAIWRMLSAGHGGDEIIAALNEAFPDIDAGRIAGDVDTLITAFQENGLLLVK